MSKSGLFAHFGSREELLLAVMDRGQQEFLKLVVNPALVTGQRAWIDTLTRATRQAIEQGQLRADTDPEQISFELFGIALVVHHHRRLLGYEKARARALAAFDALIERHAASPSRARRTAPRAAHLTTR